MNNKGTILLIIGEVVLGILLFVNPMGFTGAVIRVAGAVMLALAVFNIIVYFRLDPVEAHLEQGLAKALCLLAGGLFCLFKAEWFLNVFPVFTVIYGVAVLLTGIVRVQWTVDMLRMRVDRWYVSAIGAALSLIFAGVILFNPFTATEVLWRFIAISLLVSAAADLAIVIFVKKIEKSETKR